MPYCTTLHDPGIAERSGRQIIGNMIHLLMPYCGTEALVSGIFNFCRRQGLMHKTNSCQCAVKSCICLGQCPWSLPLPFEYMQPCSWTFLGQAEQLLLPEVWTLGVAFMCKAKRKPATMSSSNISMQNLLLGCRTQAGQKKRGGATE